MATLDRTRDFGEVSGAASDGARYYQDHKSFDANGKEINPAPAKTTKPKPKADPVVEEVLVPQPLDDQLASQLGHAL